MSKPKIFISHAHADHRIAKRFQDLLEAASAHGLEVARSSEDGKIKAGDNWYAWIDEQVLDCDVAIVLLTPASFRGNWVMWEAGAVAGVQRARSQSFKAPLTGEVDEQPGSRRVRVVGFRMGERDLGPFRITQVKDGLEVESVANLVTEILGDFRSNLDSYEIDRRLRQLNGLVKAFVDGVRDDLRFTPTFPSEGVVQEWLVRIDACIAKEDYSWLAMARRWINIAILGAGRAEANEPIDFRIHSRIARGHETCKDWRRAIGELELARELSPNDVPIAIRLGKALLGDKRASDVGRLLDNVRELDPTAFVSDREAIALRCRYSAESNDWVGVDKVLADANPDIVVKDEYLATWRAMASLRVHGAAESKRWFVQLGTLTKGRRDFWSLAAHVNAALALGDRDAVASALVAMKLSERTPADVESATRYFDEIAKAFATGIDWVELRKVSGGA